MNKTKLKKQSGLTLVELLAVLVILSFITLLVTPMIVKSIVLYDQIKTDTVLRDEADLILANVYRTLYTTKESEIQSLANESPPQDNDHFDYIQLKDGSIIGFKNEQFHVKDSIVTLQNNNIQLITKQQDNHHYSTISKVNEHTYRITLVLKNIKKDKTHTFENDITTINDLISNNN